MSSFDSSTPSIMLVDDEEDLLMLYRTFLKESGFDIVATFADPMMALEHFKLYPQRYSVVVTDLRMPHLDGLSLIKHLRTCNERIKVLLITAYFREDIVGHPEYKAQINGILQKPFEFSELKAKIIEIVSN